MNRLDLDIDSENRIAFEMDWLGGFVHSKLLSATRELEFLVVRRVKDDLLNLNTMTFKPNQIDEMAAALYDLSLTHWICSMEVKTFPFRVKFDFDESENGRTNITADVVESFISFLKK